MPEIDAGGLAAKVLTVSDGVVAGNRVDRSGAALVSRLVEVGFLRILAEPALHGCRSHQVHCNR